MDVEYFTVAEAAKKLKVTPQAIYKWIAQGRLKSVRVGADRRVTSAAIDDFVRESTEAGLDGSGTMENEIQTPMLGVPA